MIVCGLPLATGVSSWPVPPATRLELVDGVVEARAARSTSWRRPRRPRSRARRWSDFLSNAQVRLVAAEPVGDAPHEVDERARGSSPARTTETHSAGPWWPPPDGAELDRRHARVDEADRVGGAVAADADRLGVEHAWTRSRSTRARTGCCDPRSPGRGGTASTTVDVGQLGRPARGSPPGPGRAGSGCPRRSRSESGTLLSASPPRMRPRLIEGRSNRSELSRAKGSDSIARNASSAFRIALSPSHGVAPCAAVPLTSSRIASTPFACTPTCRSVGSPVIAKSPREARS